MYWSLSTRLRIWSICTHLKPSKCIKRFQYTSQYGQLMCLGSVSFCTDLITSEVLIYFIYNLQQMKSNET